MRRAYSVDNVLNARFNGIEFTGEWERVFGKPERAHSAIIWGQSGSGKTTFNMQLAKYLSTFEPVAYNSMEEGLCKGIQDAYNRVGLTKEMPMQLLSESMAEFTKRLLRKKSPNIAFIDSVKYTRFSWNAYEDFCKMFPHKLLIWVAHAKGKEPKGALAEDIRYDSSIKIYTEGFRAFVTSRYSTNSASSMDIWPKGAADYWGESLIQKIA
ncbi:MAG: ATP-binding protein [Bacteroidales bacterium]